MYIFQPDRYLLQQQIGKASFYVRGKTLDVGAGTSDRYSKKFETTEYIRLDMTPSPGVDIVGSIYAIPMMNDSVDTVVCTQVLEHVTRPNDAAKEIFRVLRTGGYAIVTVPQMNELHEEPNDYFRYTNYGLVSLFETAGFHVVEINQRGGYYAMLAQIRIRHLIDRYRLYHRPFFGRIMGKLIALYGKSMLVLDRMATSTASKKHTIGWCVVLRK